MRAAASSATQNRCSNGTKSDAPAPLLSRVLAGERERAFACCWEVDWDCGTACGAALPPKAVARPTSGEEAPRSDRRTSLEDGDLTGPGACVPFAPSFTGDGGALGVVKRNGWKVYSLKLLYAEGLLDSRVPLGAVPPFVGRNGSSYGFTSLERRFLSAEHIDEMHS